MADYDSPWKEVLDAYFEQFLAFYFPAVHALTDWGRGYEFLDKELQQVEREAELGRQVVDKLVKVWLKDGQEAWVLVHIEVQSQYEADFGRRMYVYNYRLFDKYNVRVISLAVLGDDRAGWRPSSFGYSLGGCTVHFEYPVTKLLEYVADEAALEASRNPFGTVTLAHLKTMETHGAPEARQGWKRRLTRNLYERGFTPAEVRQLYRFVDWLMDLPKELEEQLRTELAQFEKEKKMPYVTSIERLAIEEGREQGLEQGLRKGLLTGIAQCLRLRFGATDLELMTEIEQITDVKRLQAVLHYIATAASPDDLKRFLTS